MTISYQFQREHVRAGRCPVCSGTKQRWYGGGPNGDREYMGPCAHCQGTGKPTAQDIVEAAVADSGTCTRCGLPGESDDVSYREGCLGHLREYVKALEKRLIALEKP